jgi:HEAT repeat protein
VATEEGRLLVSEDRGDRWAVIAEGLSMLDMLWADDGRLYLGTDGQGVYHLDGDGALTGLAQGQAWMTSARIVGLAWAGGRLFAATPNTLYYTDRPSSAVSWTRSGPLPDSITAVAAPKPGTIYLGTATSGIYRSLDAGESWQPAWTGLGLYAGQMVRITALRADPREAEVLYAAADYVVGSTHVQASAAGVFVTVDGGETWQPLGGPGFPEARHASGMVVVPGNPLNVQAVTAEGLQGYAPDIMALLAALESAAPQERAAAARQLGYARPQGVWGELLDLLDDPEPPVRMAAADALGRIGDPAAIPGLLVAVEHPSEVVRVSAARALGLIGVESAVAPLRLMLLQGKGMEIGVAAEALARIGSPEAIDALLVALEEPGRSARWHAALAAVEHVGEPAVEPLVARLDSQDANVRRNAAQALGWTGSHSASQALAQVLGKDPDAHVREQAAWALGNIGQSSGMPLNRAAQRALDRAQVRDPIPSVQDAAGVALTRVPEQPVATAHRPASWVPMLDRLQPLRWLVLVLSLAGAAWLMLGDRPLGAWVPISRD